MAITTEDCKKFLVETYQKQGFETKGKDWTRLRKFKAGSLICREFEHQVLGKIVIEETNGKLEISKQTPAQQVILVNSNNKNSDVLKRRTFTKKAFKEAKNLILRHASEAKGSNIVHDFTWPSSWFAIPSLFTFHFNTSLKSLNSSDLVNPGDIQIKVSADKTLSTEILKENKLFFPSFITYTKDGIAELNRPTVLIDIVKELLDKGFNYNPQECDLRSVIPHQQVSVIEDKIGLDLRKNSVISNRLTNALVNDDPDEYEQLLNTVIPLYGAVDYRSNLQLCISTDAYACVNRLLDIGYDPMRQSSNACLSADIGSTLNLHSNSPIFKKHPDLIDKFKNILLNFDLNTQDDIYPLYQNFVRGYLTYQQRMLPSLLGLTETDIYEHLKCKLSGEKLARFVTDCGLYLSYTQDLNTYEHYLQKLSDTDVLNAVCKYCIHEYDPYRTPLFLGAIQELMNRNIEPDRLADTTFTFHPKHAMTQQHYQMERYFNNLKNNTNVSDSDKRKVKSVLDTLSIYNNYLNGVQPASSPTP